MDITTITSLGNFARESPISLFPRLPARPGGLNSAASWREERAPSSSGLWSEGAPEGRANADEVTCVLSDFLAGCADFLL